MKKKASLSAQGSAGTPETSGELKKNEGKIVTSLMTEQESALFIHELQANQKKLEAEIELLKLAKTRSDTETFQTEAAKAKYFSLFNFAPSGYFMLAKDGRILESNLVGDRLLGIERADIINSALIDFVIADTKHIFENFLDSVFHSKTKAYCEIALISQTDEPLWVQVSGALSPDGCSVLVNMLDISDHKHEKTVLQLNEAKYRNEFNILSSVFESPIDIIVFALNKDYCYTAFTQCHKETIKKLWGTDIEVGMNMLDVITDTSDRQKAKNNFDRALNGEYFVLTEDYGDIALYRTYYEVHYSSIKDAFGNITGLSVFVIDVSQQKQAEVALSEEENRYRILTESMKDVVWTLDPETMQFLYVSPSVEKLRGYTPEEVIAQPLDAALTPEGLCYVKHKLHAQAEEFLASGRIPTKYTTDELEQQCKDGCTIWTEVITNFYINKQTGKVEILGVTRDITERRKADKALADSRAELKAIYDNAPVMMCVLDSNRRILFANRAFTSLTGTSEENLKGGHACGVFGCINAKDDLRGCGFGI